MYIEAQHYEKITQEKNNIQITEMNFALFS